MKRLIALVVGFSMLIGGASAQMVSNPNGVVPSLSFQDIQPVLAEAGFQTELAEIGGETILRVRAMGKNLALYRKACSSETSCAGLWMFAFINDTQTLETLNLFNQNSKPARATLTNGKVLLDRYLIADYGITRGSLVVNVGVLAGMVDQWFQFSKQNGPIAVSFQPLLADPMSADGASSAHGDMTFIRALGAESSLYNSDQSHEGRLN